MFDVGFVEMVVVFILALLVLGPERLPRVARMIGLWVGRARAMFYSVRGELERELRVEEMRKAGYELEEDVKNSIRPIKEEVENVEASIKPLQEEIREVKASVRSSSESTPKIDSEVKDRQ